MAAKRLTAMRSATAFVMIAAALALLGPAMAENDDAPLAAKWIAFELNGKAVAGPTLNYAADKVSGTGGCNQFNGPISIEDDAVQIGPLVSTRMMCEGKSETETQYFAALEAARTFVLDGDTLLLKAEDGHVLLKFKK
jgi:heat shock protein HslJ